MLQIEIFENRNRSLLLCGGFPVCQRYTRRQKSLLYSFPLSPSSSGQGRHPFKVDIAGSNPAGGTTAFEQVRACFSSWPVFVSAHVRQARAPNVRQTSRKPPQRFIAGQRKGPRPRGARPRRGPFGFPVRPLGYRFACPFATRLLAPRLPLGRSSLGYTSATPRRAPLPARTATPRPIAADRRARVQVAPKRKAGRSPRNGPPLGARYSLMR